MYGLNALAFAFFLGINVLSYRLCKCSEHTRKVVLQVLCSLLLGGNLFRYTFAYPFIIGEVHIPVEFSTVAYFAVPFILLVNRKRSRSWAAYSGLMAGFFYYMTMIILGGRIYGTYPPYDIYISMFCHGTLYLCGLVTIGTRHCYARDGYKLALGVAYVSTRALLLRPYVLHAENLFIYKLLDGDLIKLHFPQATWDIALPVYYVIAIVIVLLTMRGFFKSNRRQYRKFASSRENLITA